MTAVKPWYLSKTLIANIITLILLAVGLVLENAGALHLDPQAVIWIGIGLAVGNAALRLVTSTAIEGTPAANNAATAVVTTGAPAPAQPTVEDVARLLTDLKAQRDRIDGVLSQAAAVAGPPGWSAATAPTSPTIPGTGPAV